MKIVLHGQKAFGRALLERLLELGENVVAVCGAPTSENGPEDPLITFAREKGLPVYQPNSWKTGEALDLMRSFDADLCMMAYVILQVPEPVLNAPRLGTIQFHPSLLPYHRGPSAINWAISMGETQTGLSIFWPDAGFDEGKILMTKTCEIAPTDTLTNVYFDKLFPLGIEAMVESLNLIKANVILKYEQDLSAGSYEGWFTKEIAEIDWEEPLDTSYNKVRAADSAPGAWSVIKEVSVDFYSAEKRVESGAPGTVLSISEKGVIIAAREGSILFKKMRRDGGKKLPAIDIAKELKLEIGDKFERGSYKKDEQAA